MKRTRRIEIVQYTRRITLPLGDDNEAEYSTAVDIFSMTQVDAFASEQTNEVNDQSIDPAAPTSPRHRWFWLDWLKREWLARRVKNCVAPAAIIDRRKTDHFK